VQRKILEYGSNLIQGLRYRLSLSEADFLFYSSPWKEVRQLTVVNLRNNESQDQLLKRFRKKIVKSGVLSTVRRKRWFVSKSEQRRMDEKKAIRRYKRRSYTRDYE
jgi:small subunit ribosomal protein S21